MNNEALIKQEGCLKWTSIKHSIYLAIKRIFDILVSLIGCMFLIPIIVIIKIITIISGDLHPIIFSQNRIGKDGKEFKFYKFRSMIPDADQALFELLEKNPERKKEYELNKKLENDPRITKVGKFIRKTSIDELPQLINVLKGDMSLIGNRPYLPREKKDMKKYYNDIVKTKPGLTGYWQVNGRSDTSFGQRLTLEQYYSNHASLKLDIKIFFKTFSVVLLRKGSK
jgi:undecaprenyl-phosphate galactose phosphotransferase